MTGPRLPTATTSERGSGSAARARFRLRRPDAGCRCACRRSWVAVGRGRGTRTPARPLPAVRSTRSRTHDVARAAVYVWRASALGGTQLLHRLREVVLEAPVLLEVMVAFGHH